MAKFLMVGEDTFVGTRSFGALFQVAEDDDAPGGWITREVSGYDVVSDSEPKPFNREDEDEENLTFVRVGGIWEYDTWQEARIAAMEAVATYE